MANVKHSSIGRFSGPQRLEALLKVPGERPDWTAGTEGGARISLIWASGLQLRPQGQQPKDWEQRGASQEERTVPLHTCDQISPPSRSKVHVSGWWGCGLKKE